MGGARAAEHALGAGAARAAGSAAAAAASRRGDQEPRAYAPAVRGAGKRRHARRAAREEVSARRHNPPRYGTIPTRDLSAIPIPAQRISLSTPSFQW
eukprot:2355384-Prymnesium_polylepis.1